MKRRKFREIEVHNETTLKRNKQNKEIKYKHKKDSNIYVKKPWRLYKNLHKKKDNFAKRNSRIRKRKLERKIEILRKEVK